VTAHRSRAPAALGLALLAVLVAPRAGEAATFTFAPTADARVQQATPAANFGAAPRLRVDGGRDPDVELYLRFRPARVVGRVTRAVLRLHATSASARGPLVLNAATTWAERRVTWRTRPLREGPALPGPRPGVAADAWLELDVTPLVVGNGLVAMALLTTSTDGLDVASREAAPDVRPQLVVTTDAPDPPAVALGSPLEAAASSVLLTGSVRAGGAETTYRFEYGPTTAYGSETTTASAGAGTDAVAVERALRGLQPSTTYHYRLVATNRSGTTATRDATFSTSSTTIRVAAAGDIACPIDNPCLNNARATGDVIRRLAPDLVLALGDTQYVDARPEDYVAYDAAWGSFKAITRPAVGNHEYHTRGAAGYFGYFGRAAGDPKLGYYSFDAGSWHVVAINSECGQVSCEADGAQAAWLRDDLRDHPTRCTLAIMHRPYSGTPGSGELRPLIQILYEEDADLMLAGHLHAYERFAPVNPARARDDARGIRQITVGTGGVAHGTLGAAPANVQARNNTAYGVLSLTLGPTAYDWRFENAANGTFTESGSTACH
jgi:acid phosphatase type 7